MLVEVTINILNAFVILIQPTLSKMIYSQDLKRRILTQAFYASSWPVLTYAP